MDLTLQHLRLLREVARQSTITAAADALGYTRSAVSQQLMGLERATGVAVLERVGRNVRLTDAGRVLVGYAEDVLVQVEAAQAALEAAAGDVRGVLDIGIYESVAGPFLAPLVARMGVDYPDLLLRSREIEPEDALEAVTIGELDLAFTLTYPRDPTRRSDDIIRTPVVDESFVAVVPVEDALPELIELGDLADRPFVCPSPSSGCGRAVVLACREAGFEPDIVHQVDSYPTGIDLVGAVGGVAVIPEFSVARRPDVRSCRLRTPVSRTIDVSHRRSSSERPTIRATLQSLLEISGAPARALAS